MEKLTSISTIKYIMEKYSFKFSKGLGQNFIIDENIVEKILNGADISENDFILEVGPGIGVMTKAMAKRAKKVVAVEIDSTLIPVLDETLAETDNVKIINEDILKLDINKVIEEEFNGVAPKVIANLPYYVTTPIIMRFLEESISVEDIVVMIQKEVGERIEASPNSKVYGALSVVIQYYSDPTIVAKVPRTVFMPQPNVDSIVVRLNILKSPRVELLDKEIFFKTVKAAFSMRRKTLLNTISAGFSMDKESVKNIFEKANIDYKRRGESLSIHEFAKLSNKIKEFQK